MNKKGFTLIELLAIIVILAIIALIAGVALLSIAILAIIKQKRKDIKEKELIIERLKQELNATNIKYIQAEERFLAQKNILEQEKKNNAQMIEEIKSQKKLLKIIYH